MNSITVIELSVRPESGHILCGVQKGDRPESAEISRLASMSCSDDFVRCLDVCLVYCDHADVESWAERLMGNVGG